MKNKITTKSIDNDIQAQKTGFKNLPIDKVGVRNLRVPLLVRVGELVTNVVATMSSYCNLNSETKGINMSRIARTINETIEGGESFNNLSTFVNNLRVAHNSRDAYIKAEFSLLIEGKSPMSKLTSWEPVEVILKSEMIDGVVRNYKTIKITTMSLCPCSKDMSLLTSNLTENERIELLNSEISSSLRDKISKAGFGAHNQKSTIEVTVEDGKDVELSVVELIDVVNHSASAPTWSVLKRPDEKYITEISYMGGYFDDDKCFVAVDGAGAKFVEDISRNVVDGITNYIDKEILDFVVVVNNDESIH